MTPLENRNRLDQSLRTLQRKWGCRICNDQFTEPPASHIVGSRHRTNNDLLLWSCRDCGISALQISQSVEEATKGYQQFTQGFQPTGDFLDISPQNEPYTLLQPWSCKTCNITTVESQELHKDNKIHRTNLAKPLYCEACNVIINVETKANHERGKRHMENIRAQGDFEMDSGFGYTAASLRHDSHTSTVYPVDSWTCTACNITVPEWFEEIHNRGKQHRKNKSKKQLWTCQICNSTYTLSGRESHESSKKHLKKVKSLPKSKKTSVALLPASLVSYDSIIDLQSNAIRRHKILRLIPPEKKSKRYPKPLSLSFKKQFKTPNPIDHPGPHRYCQSKPGAIRRQNFSKCSVCGDADPTEYSRLQQPQCASCYAQECDSIMLEEEWLSYWELPEQDYSSSVERTEHQLYKAKRSLLIGTYASAVGNLLVHQLARKKTLLRHHVSKTYANPTWNPRRDNSRLGEEKISSRRDILACRDKKCNFLPEYLDDDSEERIARRTVMVNMKVARHREGEVKILNLGRGKGNKQERNGIGGRATKPIINTRKHLTKLSKGYYIETLDTSSRGRSNEKHLPIAFKGQKNEC